MILEDENVIDRHNTGRVSARDLVRLYGTTEQPKVLRKFEKGALAFLYSAGAIRQIEWNGIEVVRAIMWPIRDTSWGTYSPEIVDVDLLETDDFVSGRLVETVDDGRLISELSFKASAKGEFTVALTMTPVEGQFTTNRAGLTVLHPIHALAGAPVSVRHSNGSLDESVFPKHISPGQPLKDISGLRYEIASATVEISFEGEVFEMEDQRNWSDASFKTYCVPLKHPFTYEIDSPITQSVNIKLSGGIPTKNRCEKTSAIDTEQLSSKAPEIGLALESGWQPKPANLDAILCVGASHLVVRAAPSDSELLSAAKSLADHLGAKIALEFVLDSENAPKEALTMAAQSMKALRLDPTHVIALPASYLASHQPIGPWPSGPSPDAIANIAKEVFPSVQVGGGMLTNFTEFNRCRPAPEICDFITHGSSAIVHACDDHSVLETLEALPQIYESARYGFGDTPYRLGLVSIGMRSNPYGAAIKENPSQIRETMAREDPRHRGLFGAAWAVGVLQSTTGNQIEALCLAAPTGPFGIVYEPQHYTQSGFDDGVGTVYPLFHVVRCAAEMSGQNRLVFTGLPEGLVGYGVSTREGCVAMIANVTNQSVNAPLSQAADIAVMNTDSFDAAVSNVDWISGAYEGSRNRLELDPYAVGFLKW